ncbi:MAG: hypothetical protein IT305_29045 [Chloroflexi bacterium]|nr:hypothetical protein [Chloroflexota bacterium]
MLRRSAPYALVGAALLLLSLLPAAGHSSASAQSVDPRPLVEVAREEATPAGVARPTDSPAVFAPSRRRPQPAPSPGPNPAPGAPEPPPTEPATTAGESVRNDLSPPLSSLEGTAGRQHVNSRALARRTRSTRSGARGVRPAAADPVRQAVPGRLPLAPLAIGFEGSSNLDNQAAIGALPIPPDPSGDVGPHHYLQLVNLTLAVYTRDGSRVLGPLPGSAPWAGFGGACETDDGDGVALYDHLADRWVLSQFSLPDFPAGPFYHCIAVSQTGDPTGRYYRYAFRISDHLLPDYPKLGVWPDAYLYTANTYRETTLEGAGAFIGAFDRDRMLRGQPAGFAIVDLSTLDTRYFGFLPADLDGPAPPRGTPGYFMAADDNVFGWPNDRLTVFGLRVSWSALPSISLSGPTVLLTEPFDSNLCNFQLDCIPQPGTSARLDALSDRMMYRLQYRHLNGEDVLVSNLTVDADGSDHAGVRWFDVRHRPGDGWSIRQQGTYAPDDNDRWMGSAAMDRLGNLAIGFSIASRTVFPSIRYVGRAAGDPPGLLPREERVLVEGHGVQTTSLSRWGDYSMLTVDPADDCTFWYTNEYYPATSARNWHTRIGAFQLPGCAEAASAAEEDAGHRHDDDHDEPRRLTEAQRRQRERTNQLGLDDDHTEGNVVAVRCAENVVSIANRDGDAEVRLLGDARKACADVRVGDYLMAEGAKQHEALFDAERITTERR